MSDEMMMDQIERDLKTVAANIATVRETRWRMIRNRHLLDENRRLLKQNQSRLDLIKDGRLG